MLFFGSHKLKKKKKKKERSLLSDSWFDLTFADDLELEFKVNLFVALMRPNAVLIWTAFYKLNSFYVYYTRHVNVPNSFEKTRINTRKQG